LISDLYKKEKSVQQLLDFYVHPNEKELFREYSHTVSTAFYPEQGYEIKLHKGRQAISDPTTLIIKPRIINNHKPISLS